MFANAFIETVLLLSCCQRNSNQLLTASTYGSGRQSLRSASRVDFVIPHARKAIKQHRSFSAWNSLPSELRSLPRDLFSSFFKLLKTFIFPWAWRTSEQLPLSGA